MTEADILLRWMEYERSAKQTRAATEKILKGEGYEPGRPKSSETMEMRKQVVLAALSDEPQRTASVSDKVKGTLAFEAVNHMNEPVHRVLNLLEADGLVTWDTVTDTNPAKLWRLADA